MICSCLQCWQTEHVKLLGVRYELSPSRQKVFHVLPINNATVCQLTQSVCRHHADANSPNADTGGQQHQVKPPNGTVLPSSCQAVAKQLPSSCQAVARQLPGSCQAVAKQLPSNTMPCLPQPLLSILHALRMWSQSIAMVALTCNCSTTPTR